MARILIIEDDEKVRAILCQILRLAGHDVTAAANGVLGVAAFRKSPAELVITDLFMPEMDGLETIFELKRLCREVKCIGISGATDAIARATLAAATRLGADRTLAKPFTRNQLLDVVNRVLAPCGGPLPENTIPALPRVGTP